jgi:hypothetical protein
MKITALDESADFATLGTEKLFSKLKSHELSRKDHPNHNASFSSKALITGAHVGGHVANPTNTTDSSALEFALSCLQLRMSSTRASPTMRSPCWRGSFVLCTGSARRGDLLGASLSAATPPTSSSTAPRGRSLTPPQTSTTTLSRMTTAMVTTRRSTASVTRRKRSSRRCCPKHVQPSATSTSPATTPPAQRRMRDPSARQATSPAFASWASHRGTSPTPTLTLM